MHSEKMESTTTIQNPNDEYEDECGWQFIVIRPDGGWMYSSCFDTAVRWARILAQIFAQPILCRFVGEREEYPTYDMLEVSFLCDGDGEFIHKEKGGLYYDMEEWVPE